MRQENSQMVTGSVSNQNQSTPPDPDLIRGHTQVSQGLSFVDLFWIGISINKHANYIHTHIIEISLRTTVFSAVFFFVLSKLIERGHPLSALSSITEIEHSLILSDNVTFVPRKTTGYFYCLYRAEIKKKNGVRENENQNRKFRQL